MVYRHAIYRSFRRAPVVMVCRSGRAFVKELSWLGTFLMGVHLSGLAVADTGLSADLSLRA